MIPMHIPEQLVCSTQEEVDFLQRKEKIDKSIFSHETSSVIDHRYLLEDY